MPTEITVRGSFSALEPPERATVRATIGYEGAEMRVVYEQVAHDLETVTDALTRLVEADPSAVASWSAEQLRTWSDRPWNQDGRQLPLVHHAAVTITVEFCDFAALSRWVGEQVDAVEGFRVDRVSWALTEARRDAVAADARARAVRDAAARAQQYADALDLGAVRPVALADAGMLSAPAHSDASAMMVSAAPAGARSAPEVELVPADIRIAATVDARFVAG